MPPRRQAGVVTQYAMLAGPLLSMLDSSVVNVAAEPIARSLHASLGTVQWAVSGYLLALGTGLAGTAYLARRFGPLAVYRASLVAFTAASALCAVAPGSGALIGFRAGQGLVAAPLVPLAMSMLLGKSGKARSMSPVAGILLFAAPAFGPTVGGALIGAAGWRLIFAINVPFGAVAIWAVGRLDGPERAGEGNSGDRSGKSEFDLFGLALLAAGLLLSLLGASEGGTDGWGSLACLGPLVAGGTLLAGYVPWASGRARPALDLSLARRPVAALSMGLCALASVVTWAAVFLLPVFVQSVQGRSALAAGLAMAPQGLVTGLSTVLGARVSRRFTVRSTVCGGFLVLGGASLLVELVGAGTPLWVVSLILAGRSASIGLIISPLLAALTGPLPPERMADASTLFNMVNRVAGSFGIGVLASLYAVLARSAGGPVYALHVSGIVIACVAGLGAVGALAGGLARPGPGRLEFPARVLQAPRGRGCAMSQSVSSRVEVAVDAQTAFRAFTEEMDLWWVRGPINFYDAARAVGRVCEPGVGGRLLEVYEDDALEMARITAWEPGVRVAWSSALDDVSTEVTFTAADGGGTLVVVTATIPDGGVDRGGTAYVRVVPPWFGAWCARRDSAPRVATEAARLALALSYPKPATAARWLSDAFGLVPTNPLPDDDEAAGWIEFHVGNCSLMVFGLAGGDGGAAGSSGAFGAFGASGGTHVPWVFVDDLDAHYAHAVSRGAVIVEGIHQHGYRAYVARDPDGYTWTIAQARPGMR